MSLRVLPPMFGLPDVGSPSWWELLRAVGQWVADGDTVELRDPPSAVWTFTVEMVHVEEWEGA